MPASTTRFLLGLLTGAALGATGALLIPAVDPASAPPPAPPLSMEPAVPAPPDALVSPVQSPPAPDQRTAAAEAPAAELPPTAGGDDLFTAAMLSALEEGLERGWRELRKDAPSEDERAQGRRRFRQSVIALPVLIGRQLAERRDQLDLALEDTRTGGVMTTLQRLQGGAPGPLFDLVRDRGTFDRFFVAETTGSAIDGSSAVSAASLMKGEPVADGTTLVFPAGVFALMDFGSYWRERFPRDLTLRGAGMNSTLLVLQEDLSAYDTVRNLTLENLTLHTNNNYGFDIRQPPMSLTLRNVRCIGFDMGAGASCLFGTEGLALRATDCEFLGGYGRGPEFGQLFDIRHNGLLARFERCLVARVRAFGHVHAGATLVFSACRLEEIFDEGTPSNILLDGTTVTRRSRESESPLARDLNDLFPGWQSALQR